MSSVKVLIVFAVWAFNCRCDARCERSDQLMRDFLSLSARAQREKLSSAESAEAFRELKPVVGLNAFD